MLSESLSTTFFLLIIFFQLSGGLASQVFFRGRAKEVATFSTAVTALSFVGCGVAWLFRVPNHPNYEILGYVATELSWVLATLILFTSLVIHAFSLRYMGGDRLFTRYFLYLTLVIAAILSSVVADHLVLFLVSLSFAYYALVKLMVHNSEWFAAKQGGMLAAKNFGLGLLLLAAGGLLLFLQFETLSISQILKAGQDSYRLPQIVAVFCFMMASFMFSGIWPFHRFLVSSTNSPTPISALMHAGLVNGGGVILFRFAPLYAESSWIMNIVLIFGLVTVTLGTFWKLIQTDIKRMLACSTMAQMGFMFIQCGLGLFPAAIAHLCWHGVFKAYLFLKSGSSLTEERCQAEKKLNFKSISLTIICGVLGAIGFMSGSFHPLSLYDSHLVLIAVASVGAMQLGYVLMDHKKLLQSFLLASGLCLLMGWFYASSVGLIERALGTQALFTSHPLSSIHWTLMIIMGIPWVMMLFRIPSKIQDWPFWQRFYVGGLNSSQPHPKTITAHWTEYQY